MFHKSNKNTQFINITIRTIDDVFKSFDYTSLNGKSIKVELEEYIVKSVKSYSVKTKTILVFNMIRDSEQKDLELLRETLYNHFSIRALETNLFLKQQLNQWKINMIIGLLFLILCLVLVQVLDVFSYIYILKIIKESLSIVGWVALWEPLNFIFFVFQSIKKDILYYKKLSNIPIIIYNNCKIKIV